MTSVRLESAAQTPKNAASAQVLHCLHRMYFEKFIYMYYHGVSRDVIRVYITVVPAKSDSDVMFCLQSY